MINVNYLVWVSWSWKTEILKDLNNKIIINFLDNIEKVKDNIEKVIKWDYKYICLDEVFWEKSDEKEKLLKSLIDILKVWNEKYYLIVTAQSHFDIAKFEENIIR